MVHAIHDEYKLIALYKTNSHALSVGKIKNIKIVGVVMVSTITCRVKPVSFRALLHW